MVGGKFGLRCFAIGRQIKVQPVLRVVPRLRIVNLGRTALGQPLAQREGLPAFREKKMIVIY